MKGARLTQSGKLTVDRNSEVWRAIVGNCGEERAHGRRRPEAVAKAGSDDP
jgi:hypothetical protein